MDKTTQRIIKFRAWDIEFKIIREWKYFKEYRTLWHILSSSSFEWMQYTGLKNKNGKEIYEGDILKFKGSQHEIQVDEIVFEDGSFDFNKGQVIWSEHPTYIEEGEVIGNKFENKELLK